mgnify:CR=1 FL=1
MEQLLAESNFGALKQHSVINATVTEIREDKFVVVDINGKSEGFIPQGEFVAYGALTLAIFQTGKVPGTVWLLLILASVAALMELSGQEYVDMYATRAKEIRAERRAASGADPS